MSKLTHSCCYLRPDLPTKLAVSNSSCSIHCSVSVPAIKLLERLLGRPSNPDGESSSSESIVGAEGCFRFSACVPSSWLDSAIEMPDISHANPSSRTEPNVWEGDTLTKLPDDPNTVDGPSGPNEGTFEMLPNALGVAPNNLTISQGGVLEGFPCCVITARFVSSCMILITRSPPCLNSFDQPSASGNRGNIGGVITSTELSRTKAPFCIMVATKSAIFNLKGLPAAVCLKAYSTSTGLRNMNPPDVDWESKMRSLK